MKNDPLELAHRAWCRLRLYLRAAARLLAEASDMELVRERFPHLIFGQDVIVKGADRFFPGRNVFIDHRAYLNCAGGDWNDYAGYIKTGDRVEIGPFSQLWGAGGITIGDNVHIASHVSITAHTSLQVLPDTEDIWAPLRIEFKPVFIEDNVLICSLASIGPGVRIGHHAQIGAGSVVLDDVPPYALAVGAPARVVRVNGPSRDRFVTSNEAAAVDIAG